MNEIILKVDYPPMQKIFRPEELFLINSRLKFNTCQVYWKLFESMLRLTASRSKLIFDISTKYSQEPNTLETIVLKVTV